MAPRLPLSAKPLFALLGDAHTGVLRALSHT